MFCCLRGRASGRFEAFRGWVHIWGLGVSGLRLRVLEVGKLPFPSRL